MDSLRREGTQRGVGPGNYLFPADASYFLPYVGAISKCGAATTAYVRSSAKTQRDFTGHPISCPIYISLFTPTIKRVTPLYRISGRARNTFSSRIMSPRRAIFPEMEKLPPQQKSYETRITMPLFYLQSGLDAVNLRETGTAIDKKGILTTAKLNDQLNVNLVYLIFESS